MNLTGSLSRRLPVRFCPKTTLRRVRAAVGWLGYRSDT